MIEVLHLASFQGNAGDTANHSGLYRRMRALFGDSLSFERVEIRRLYENYDGENPLSLDSSFVREANKRDLLVVGGGEFFSVWLDESSTGTTIDLSKKQLEELSVPTVFYAMGCVVSSCASPETVNRFSEFVRVANAQNNILTTFRNDGSRERAALATESDAVRNVPVVPDGGFFMKEPVAGFGREICGPEATVAVNVATDMPKVRFSSPKARLSFLNHVADFARAVAERARVVFTPHTYKDLEATYEAISKLPAHARRSERVRVAPLITSFPDARSVFSIYKVADVSVGARFHANVCPIRLGTPSFGVSTGHPKVEGVYESLDMSDRIVRADSSTLSEDLYGLVSDSFVDQEPVKRRYESAVQRLDRAAEEFERQIKSLLV